MNAERWKQIDTVFDAALEREPATRLFFLASICGSDADLLQAVTELLKASDESESFIETSAVAVAAKNHYAEIANPANRQIAHYKIISLLGAGGMSEVYLAHDTKLNRPVALKILPAHFVSDAERVRRFRLEAQSVSALNHPNIVTVFDFGREKDELYIATELVEGKTLREILKTEKLTALAILKIAVQITAALEVAHRAGIVHRDIKPENIMLRADGYVKVLDFGLAKLTKEQTDKNRANTKSGLIVGTLNYLSPEQTLGNQFDERTDLWSLGVCLFEMLAGKQPFAGATQAAVFNSILHSTPDAPSESNQTAAPEFDRIVGKALEKDQALRYQTASDFGADLKRLKRQIDSLSMLSSSAEIAAPRNIVRRSATVLRKYQFFGLALIILLAFGFGYRYFNRESSQATRNVDWLKAKNVQITDSFEAESYPSLAPDGKSFVFSMNSTGNQDIYAQRVGGKKISNLTVDSVADDSMPTFSPDGKLLAFRSERDGGGIYLMEATGENVRRISDFGFHPSWSPDNSKIVVSERAAIHHTLHTVPNSSLWIIDVKTGGKQLLETSGDAIMPSWSPNGNRIAFWFVRPGGLGEIATVAASSSGGGEPVIITKDAFSDWNPVWSPDGKYLYFASDRADSMSLWRVAIDELSGKSKSDFEPVATPAKYCRHITFSRDGKRLGYVRYESKSNLQTVGFDENSKKTTGEISWVTQGNHEITNPVLSPNNQEYVVRNPKQNQEDLVIFNKDGSNWRNLTNDKFLKRIPSWSHDNKKIVFHSNRTGKYQVWTINADGSDLQQITFSEKTGAYIGIFSPDDSRLAFAEINEKTQKPLIVDLTKTWAEQTPQPIEIKPEESAWAVDWSPDGNKLLMLFFNRGGDVDGIFVYNLKTGVYEKMVDTGSSPVWLKDNRHFIFNNQKSIFLCDSETKKVTEILTPPAYEIQNANISADNKTLYFRYLQVDADIWLLDAAQPEQKVQ